LKIDNAEVRQMQISKLNTLRAERNSDQVQSALSALTNGARGGANLLELSVQAARAKATVGEISDALEAAFGRHRAVPHAIDGVYVAAMGAASPEVRTVDGLVRDHREETGSAPRLLVAKVGQDGHDRGQKVIASAFVDLGFDVRLGPLFATPEEVADQATAEEVDIVGVSSLAGGHLTLVPQLRAALNARGRSDVMIVVGGVVPEGDREALFVAGATAVFGPGTKLPEAAEALLTNLKGRVGHNRP